MPNEGGGGSKWSRGRRSASLWWVAGSGPGFGSALKWKGRSGSAVIWKEGSGSANNVKRRIRIRNTALGESLACKEKSILAICSLVAALSREMSPVWYCQPQHGLIIHNVSIGVPYCTAGDYSYKSSFSNTKAFEGDEHLLSQLASLALVTVLYKPFPPTPCFVHRVDAKPPVFGGDSTARTCKPFKEPRNRFRALPAGTTTLLDVPARQAFIGWRNRFLGSLNVYKFGLCPLFSVHSGGGGGVLYREQKYRAPAMLSSCSDSK